MLLSASGYALAMFAAIIVVFGVYRYTSQKRSAYEVEARSLFESCGTGLRLTSYLTRIGFDWYTYSVLINRNSVVLIGHKDPTVFWQGAMTYAIGIPPSGFRIEHFNHLITPTHIQRDDNGNILISGYRRSRTPLVTDGFDAPEHPIKIKIRSGSTSVQLDRELEKHGIPALIFDRLPCRWS